MDAIRFRSKFLVAAPDRVVHPASWVVRHGRIVEVEESSDGAVDIDLEDRVALPGWINPHTHLEFSDLAAPLLAGESFPEWIAAVVAHRRGRDGGAVADALARGLVESYSNGAAVVADIVSRPWQPSDLPSTEAFQRRLAETPPPCVPLPHAVDRDALRRHLGALTHPRVVPFPELIGLDPASLAASCQWGQATVQSVSAGDASHWIERFGVSPHAPYSLRLDAVANALANSPIDLPVAMHVAESREELEWLEAGRGPFLQAFERLGVPIDGPRATIAECIELLSRQRRGLLIHGNYLDRAHIERLAAAPQVSVVYCPRTHSHFGHAPYPLKALIDAGVRVVLGTDSRASNHDLRTWDDMVHARRQHPWWSAESALDSITRSAAQSLGIAGHWGTLEPGRWAHANIAPCRPEWNRANLLDAMTQTPSDALGLRPLAIGDW